eukprot:TRINITY_DN16710_c0_g1_i1.p1 TRINITY_DN16710_c0_g1~~TRINITY_DN16710_c0_g1_i1.p1  ORF type:complete len:409 (-),score=103.54 TRINITY_DN16710_c0_g1_i1:357-1583(-)
MAVTAFQEGDVRVKETVDFMDFHTLRQGFPVVCALSDKHWGPKPLRPADQDRQQILRHEDNDAEWAFKRERDQARIARHEQFATMEKYRADKAERAIGGVEIAVRQGAFAIEKSADERQRSGDGLVFAARTRLQEATLRSSQVESECGQRVRETKELLKNDKHHTVEVEELLRRAKEHTGNLREVLADEEEQTRKRIKARDEDVEKVRLQTRERVEAAKKVAEDKVAAAKSRAEAQEAELRQRLEVFVKRYNERAAQETARREEAERAAKNQQLVAAARLKTEEECMRQCTTRSKEVWEDSVEKAVQREHKVQAVVDHLSDGVHNLQAAAMRKSQDAEKQEQSALDSLGLAMHILGHHHTCQTQYNTTTDGKVSRLLHGRLHPSSPKGEMPSPRALPPPDGILSLHAQ